MSAAETIAAAIQKLEQMRDAATGGPWFFNGYGAVVGHDNKHEESIDDWVQSLAGHSFEHYGPRCVMCASISCAHATEYYDRDTTVATVPVVVGDTSAHAHKADAELIPVLHATIDAQLAILRYTQESIGIYADTASGAESTYDIEFALARAILGVSS